MIKEEQIAAARLAQMFGSELMRVDENTIQRSGEPAVRMDPKAFLVNNSPSLQQAKREKEKQLEEQLHREAMAAYPIEQTIVPIQSQPKQNFISQVSDGKLQEQLEKINTNLERIACALENLKL